MPTLAGMTCPVVVAVSPDRSIDNTSSLHSLVALAPEQLAGVDPVVSNLAVAKGIHSLANIDIHQYVSLVDSWFSDFMNRCVPLWEHAFYESPEYYHNDFRFFLLGMMCQYLEVEQGIEYNEHQRAGSPVFYVDPNDLFLCGVLDTRRGTCGNMAALHLAMAWRLYMPVSLACVNSHFVTRLDDGSVTYNFEATQSGYGGFKSDPDQFLIETKCIPEQAILCGSDLRALRPHEVLATFISLRARHILDAGQCSNDVAQILESESDWLLARHLFPTNRIIFRNQIAVAAIRSEKLFIRSEIGHVWSFSDLMQRNANPQHPAEKRSLSDARSIDDFFTLI